MTMRYAAALLMAGVALYQWMKPDPMLAIASPDSPGGFAEVWMPEQARPGTVLILAPQNCPSDAAKRAEDMATQLTQLGIPNRVSSHASLSFRNIGEDEFAAVKRSETVLNGTIPAVFFNGMGKANPSVAEVVAEFRRTGP